MVIPLRKKLKRKIEIIIDKIFGYDFLTTVSQEKLGLDPKKYSRCSPSGNKYLANVLNKLEIKESDSIMDIGCGLGILGIFINQKYQNNPNFYLLDKNTVDTKIKYGFSKDYESYNDLNETRNILLKNGLSKEQIYIKNVDQEITIDNKINLVISLKSMGYHYPIENYINLIKKTCSTETAFIFDVFEEKYSLRDVKKYFNEAKIIYEENGLHSLKRLYCSGLFL